MKVAWRGAWGWVTLVLALCDAGIAPALAETGVTDKTIVLGQSAALSGPAAKLGANMNTGARIYFDAVNARGGIYGRKIELRVRDDGYEAERAKQNTIDLVQKEGVFALFGYVGTPTSIAAAPIFTEARVPFFGAYSGATSLREPFNRYVFNIRASYADETERIVDQLATTGFSQIAVFYQDDAYGKAGLEGVSRALAQRQMKIAALATVERNSTDVAKAAATLRAAEPNAIVQISAYASCAALIKELRAAGYGGQFVNVSFVGSQELADALGPQGAGVMITQVVPFPWSSVSPLQREYAQALKAAGVSNPDFGTMEGYIAARVLVEGLRRAGRDLTREGLIAALETLHDYDLGGYTVNFTPDNHNGSRFVDITMIGTKGNFVK
jgi:ABC-type branched-subunit amino acid transport system substrate-binding protein